MTITLTTATDLEARAAWSIIAEPGDAVAGAFTQAIGHDAALTAITSSRATLLRSLTAIEGISTVTAREAANRWHPRLIKGFLTDALAAAEKHSITLIDPDTIPGLLDLGEHAPHVIWARGNVATLTQPTTDRLALVGARAATGYGEQIAHDFATALVGRGITIVSGAAYGIDGSAHRGALAAGGTTIAWLAGGVDRPYPIGHSNLIDRIAANGVVASELAPGASPTRWRFLSRNRVIAATSAATVVIEAGWRSGSLNTAGHASALGRTLGAVPGAITSAASAGCHRLIREYDAQIVTSADEAYELLGR